MNIKTIVANVESKYPGVRLDLYDWTGRRSTPMWQLGAIVVPKSSRGQGIGSTIMEYIAGEADKAGATIVLSPSTDFGGSSTERLKKFYRNFGFVLNRGRTADYAISDSMYRLPRSGNPLLETEFQKDWMLDSKVNAVVSMNPRDFIYITTPSLLYQQKITAEAQPLEKYNQYIRDGESGIPPLLKVDIKTGQVVGHEGRHRAAALIKNGEDRMNVALILVDDFTASRQRTALDIPNVWIGEFDKGRTFHIDKLYGIVRANVQIRYQKDPAIEDIAIPNDQFRKKASNPEKSAKLSPSIAAAKKALAFIKKRDKPGDDPDEEPSKIDLKDIGIDADPDPFICTNTAVILAKLLKNHGANVYGFAAWDNETGTIADGYDGHDFVVLGDGTIVDWWRCVYGDKKPGTEIVLPGTPEYAEYGDPNKWTKVPLNNEYWGWAKKIPAIEDIK